MSLFSPTNIRALIEADPVMSRIYDQFGPPPNLSRPPGFESLAHIILEQQVSLESAKASYLKLKSYIGTFSPENIRALTPDEFRNCTISRQKGRYLQVLASAIQSNELDLMDIGKRSPEIAHQQLTSIVGIGPWTAEVYQIFCLQTPDIFPAGDVALIKTIRELYQAKDKEECIEIARQWAPRRTLACFFLWHYYLSKRGRQPPI